MSKQVYVFKHDFLRSKKILVFVSQITMIMNVNIHTFIYMYIGFLQLPQKVPVSVFDIL